MTLEQKLCRKCNQYQDLQTFRSGNICTVCVRKNVNEYYYTNKKKIMEKRYKTRYANRTEAPKKVDRHGLSDTPLHKVWAGMINRCSHKGSSRYKYYGGRGIKVCDRWKVFSHFYQDNKDQYRQGLTIERMNVYGDYCPENVTWITPKQQATNTRRSVHLTYNGETKTQIEWSRALNISKATIYTRRQRGWPIHMVLSKQKFSKHTKVPKQFTI